MRGYQGVLSWSVLLAAIGGTQAKLDLDSTQNLVVYWGMYLADTTRKHMLIQDYQVKTHSMARVTSSSSRWHTTVMVSKVDRLLLNETDTLLSRQGH